MKRTKNKKPSCLEEMVRVIICEVRITWKTAIKTVTVVVKLSTSKALQLNHNKYKMKSYLIS